MNFADLFQTVAKGTQPSPLPEDQFEFVINRKERRIAGGIIDVLFADKETLRVQTNRLFAWSGPLVLPDTSTGSIRDIACTVRVEGRIKPDETSAKVALQACLSADFDIDALIARLLNENVCKLSLDPNIQGHWIRAMRGSQAAWVQSQVAKLLQDSKLPVERVIIGVTVRDTRPFLEFEDSAGTLEIRSTERLEKNRVGYKVRMIWGKSDECVIARLTYNGTFEGLQPGLALERPAVTGQIQPLEAWFRQLLAATLAEESWETIRSYGVGTPVPPRVIERINIPLGRGVGRQVDTLVIVPTVVAPSERASKFSHLYSITGVQGDGLEIEHEFKYALIDRDRWTAKASPEPEAFLRDQIIMATKSALVAKRFSDVVELYLDGTEGEKRICEEIGKIVTPVAGSIGFRLTSHAVILSIPEKDFVQGRRIAIAERPFALADPHLAPNMTFDITVRIAKDRDAKAAFARELAKRDDFEDRVRASLTDALETRMRRFSALEYYGSRSVNGGAPDPAAIAPELPANRSSLINTRDGIVRPMADPHLDPFAQAICEAVSLKLGQVYGLEVSEFRLAPGADPLIERMKELADLPLRRVVPLEFMQVDSDAKLMLKATTTIFIKGIDPRNWSRFYYNAQRCETINDHLKEIYTLLVDTVALLEEPVVRGWRNRFTESLPQSEEKTLAKQLSEVFVARMRNEFGLEAELRALRLNIWRQDPHNVNVMDLQSLKEELRQLLEKRVLLAQQNVYEDDTDEQKAIRSRVNRLKKEIAELEQQGEAAAAAIEWVIK